MKKFIFSLFIAVALLGSREAFALNCLQSQVSGGSDFCTTGVTVAADETTLVSEGHVLVYDISSGTAAGIAGQVELGDASVETNYVAGIAQGSIASGRSADVVVRGKAKLRIVGAVASGDPLYVSSTEGRAGSTGSTGAKPIGFALQAGSASSTIDAYITIV